MVLVPRTEVREEEPSLAEARKFRETLHCENDQTKTSSFLTTGMFNLIVKDPCRTPPERAALDQGIRSQAARPRTCCAAYIRPSRILSASTETISTSRYLSIGISSRSSALTWRAVQHKNLKDRPRMPGSTGRHSGGHFAQERLLPLVMQWIVRSGKALPSLPFPAQSGDPTWLSRQQTCALQVIGMG
jgi:hypothetical protein